MSQANGALTIGVGRAAAALALVVTMGTNGLQATAGAAGKLPVGKAYTSQPPVPPPGHCHARGVLPDPKCTPGAVNPAVTQANIASTICRPGYSESVRPPESYTETLKRREMASYNDHQPIWDYELDHLVSLELGGAPSDPRNLWPELGASPNPKDRVEDAAHAAVCDHRLALVTAQQEIATNWVALGEQLGLGDLARLVPTARKPPPATASTPSRTVPATSPSGHYYKPGEWCPFRDLGDTTVGPYGKLTCEQRAGGGQPRWTA